MYGVVGRGASSSRGGSNSSCGLLTLRPLSQMCCRSVRVTYHVFTQRVVLARASSCSSSAQGTRSTGSLSRRTDLLDYLLPHSFELHASIPRQSRRSPWKTFLPMPSEFYDTFMTREKYQFCLVPASGSFELVQPLLRPSSASANTLRLVLQPTLLEFAAKSIHFFPSTPLSLSLSTRCQNQPTSFGSPS